ncbi:MAG: hypothetical protein ACXACH_03020, partial [Candidatus Hermodarchaeia archaeon]
LNTVYDPAQFPGLIYKLKGKNEISFLLFASGKMVCAGAKSQNEAELAVQRFVEKFRQAGIEIVDPPQVTPQKSVGIGNLGKEVNIDRVHSTTPYSREINKRAHVPEDIPFTEFIESEPFPWLIFKSFDVGYILSSSGKTLMVGKTDKDIPRAFQKLKDSLYWLEF